jgi:hypothetical protein
MKVVILARTKMSGLKICFGGMSETGQSLRLMNDRCDYYSNSCPYQVGEIWDMTVKPCERVEAPHLEDTSVLDAKLIGAEADLRAFILERANPWGGGIDSIFDGKIHFTNKGSGYISYSGGLPSASTGFWIPDKDLQFSNDPRPAYSPHDDWRYLSYVGTASPEPTIRKDTLVRVSLAKWWKPPDADSALELRCYAQLSGWY